jgi:hypothetical protein
MSPPLHLIAQMKVDVCVLLSQVILIFNVSNSFASVTHKHLYLFGRLDLMDDSTFKI